MEKALSTRVVSEDSSFLIPVPPDVVTALGLKVGDTVCWHTVTHWSASLSPCDAGQEGMLAASEEITSTYSEIFEQLADD